MIALANGGSDMATAVKEAFALTKIPAPKPPADLPGVKPAAALLETAAAARPVYQGSGMTAWTPEWRTWCAKYFPNSWDPRTGTVIHASSTVGERVLCK